MNSPGQAAGAGATLLDRRCDGGGRDGKPCTVDGDCPGGGTCEDDQGIWTFTQQMTLLDCSGLAINACAADCDVMIRVRDHNLGGGAFTGIAATAGDKKRADCAVQVFDPTPRDNRGRCVAPGACVGGVNAGAACVFDAQCASDNCGGAAVGAACGPFAGGGCPGGQVCWQRFCAGGGEAGEPCVAAANCAGGAACQPMVSCFSIANV